MHNLGTRKHIIKNTIALLSTVKQKLITFKTYIYHIFVLYAINQGGRGSWYIDGSDNAPGMYELGDRGQRVFSW